MTEAHRATEQAGQRRRGVMRWLIVLVLLGLMVQGVVLLERLEPRLLPVRVIAIEGEVHRHSLIVLQETIGEQLDGGLIMADLAAIRDAVEALPWIAEVSVRRVWPERLELHVREHRPVARWGADGLVTAAGTVFRPASETIPPGLPQLEGADHQAGLVIDRYLAWREQLAPLDVAIAALRLEARGAWHVQLHNGLTLVLGSQQVDARLARFIRAYPSLRLAGLPIAVDLRYANGLAVRWAGGEQGRRSAATSLGRAISRERS